MLVGYNSTVRMVGREELSFGLLLWFQSLYAQERGAYIKLYAGENILKYWHSVGLTPEEQASTIYLHTRDLVGAINVQRTTLLIREYSRGNLAVAFAFSYF